MKTFFRDLIRIPERERKGITLLSLIILGSLVLISFRSHLLAKPVPVDEDKYKELMAWSDALEQETVNVSYALKKDYRKSKSTGYRAKQKKTVFPIDVNVASFHDLRNAGFPEKVASGLMAWRNSGKVFKTAKDIRSVRGMNDSLFFLVIPKLNLVEEVDFHKEEVKIVSKPLTDINTADSTQLVAIPGIGPVTARRIIRYRERLGGFHSIDQLTEVYGFTEERFQQIRPHLTLIDSPELINLNTCSLQWLLEFPYLKPTIAKGIFNYREKHGPFRSVEELMNTDLVDADLYAKIAPYFFVK